MLPELGMCVLSRDVLTYSLQISHPRYCQVTILQHRPSAFIARFFDDLLGQGTCRCVRKLLTRLRYWAHENDDGKAAGCQN